MGTAVTKLTVGQPLYCVGEEPDGKATIETWIVRTIRGGKITAIWKLSHTWGKRSKKHGDIGWCDPIPTWCRKTWRVVDMERWPRSGPFAWSLFTTKRAAIRDAIKTTEPDDFDTPEQYDRHIASLKRMRP